MSLNSKLSTYYQYVHFLSIDVVAGVLSVMVFADRILSIIPSPVWWLILPMAVWSFYTFDHLIDGIKSGGEAVIGRHSFHYRYRKLLGALAALFGLTALLLSLLFLEPKIIFSGFTLGLVVLVYFTILFFYGKKKPILLQKELIIAFVYVFGIWLAPLVWHGKISEIFIIVVLTLMLLLAWAEGIMASYFDYENDLKDVHSSFSVLFGKRNSRRFLIILHILVFLLIKISIFFISTNLQFAALMILAFMNLVLLLIVLYPNWFQKNERYRVMGEAVFWLPGVIYFF